MQSIKFFFLLTVSICFSQEKPMPVLEDLGHLFPNVRDIAISPNGNEIFFTAQSVMGNLSAIMVAKKEGEKWNVIEVAPFSGKYFDLEPFFSHDGLKLYFVSTRPLDQTSTEPKDFDIWFVERNTLDDEWSIPKNMGRPINTEYGEFYPSIASNGNFYFTRDNTTLNRKDDIYVSVNSNGIYKEPQVLPNTINTESYEYNAFIAPDESYLLFGGYNRKDGLGSGDIYISYNTKKGWTQAKNLGDKLNSNKMDYCPFVHNGLLYFTSKRDSTKVIVDKPYTSKKLIEEFRKHENGSSRLYVAPLKSILK